jgi:NADPH:quinone reductase-like Zn-dependent oxidoreductase
MRAVVCAAPGPVSVLKLQDMPLPVPDDDQVLIRILGFGINRAGNYDSFSRYRNHLL